MTNFTYNYNKYIARIEYLYFADRRVRTTLNIVYHSFYMDVGNPLDARLDASYCLDKPDFVEPIYNYATYY